MQELTHSYPFIMLDQTTCRSSGGTRSTTRSSAKSVEVSRPSLACLVSRNKTKKLNSRTAGSLVRSIRKVLGGSSRDPESSLDIVYSRPAPLTDSSRLLLCPVRPSSHPPLLNGSLHPFHLVHLHSATCVSHHSRPNHSDSLMSSSASDNPSPR